LLHDIECTEVDWQGKHHNALLRLETGGLLAFPLY